MRSKAWIFSDEKSQSIFSALLDVVVRLQRGDGPLPGTMQVGGPMWKFGLKLANLCAEDDGKEAKPQTFVYGKEALDKRIAALEDMANKETVPDDMVVRDCLKFKYMLDVPGKKALDALAAKARLQIADKDKGGASSSTDASGAMASMVAVHASLKSKAAEAKKAPAKPKKALLAKKKKGPQMA